MNIMNNLIKSIERINLECNETNLQSDKIIQDEIENDNAIYYENEKECNNKKNCIGGFYNHHYHYKCSINNIEYCEECIKTCFQCKRSMNYIHFTKCYGFNHIMYIEGEFDNKQLNGDPICKDCFKNWKYYEIEFCLDCCKRIVNVIDNSEKTIDNSYSNKYLKKLYNKYFN